MLLIIDNYDSFAQNILHWIDIPEDKILLRRNDTIELSEITALPLNGIVVSPGPMSPDEAGISNDAVRHASAHHVPLLGICLGHQCLGAVFGCNVERHPQPTHGKRSRIMLTECALYAGLGNSLEVGRYHSLHITRQGFNHQALRITATGHDGTIMSVEHRSLPLFGVQYHPESVLTGSPGRTILNNFARICGL